MHAVVKTIVQLASNLRMHVVAEGIETSEQYAILQKWVVLQDKAFISTSQCPLKRQKNCYIKIFVIKNLLHFYGLASSKPEEKSRFFHL